MRSQSPPSVLHVHDKFEPLPDNIKSNIYEKKMFLNGLKIGYQLDVYGRNNFSNWLTKIGFKNEKHTSKISIWREHGHYLPKNR